MRSSRVFGIAVICIVFLAACAHQPVRDIAGTPGFFLGLVHGFLAIFSLIGSLFLDVRIYAFPNTGFWYECGFLFGFFMSLLTAFLSVMARVGGWIS
jgi:hypothetical protein